ncbi:MAG: transposase [Bacteroidales bacterium]|nr:transposase [Bacteroidales bacterium]
MSSELWQAYSRQKQTCKELAERYLVSESTIKRRLRNVTENFECKNFPLSGVVLMDATYFGRNWCVALLMDAASGNKLWRKYVRYETITDYQEGIDFILSQGYVILGIVCDGLKGIFKQFSMFPVQMCQRHQIDIVRRYLTRNPKLEAGKELYALIKNITKLTKEEFVTLFEEWEEKWIDFLDERTKDLLTNKTHFTHKKLRSACLSIKRNMSHLFVYKEIKEMPNTNNALEGTFTALKNRLRNHNGMSKENRKRFIDGFLKA